MEKEDKKETKRLENSLYKERYQFVLQINDDIICQRYFKINGFVNESLESEDLKLVLDESVKMIQDDLISKSRVYEWFTYPTPKKLTGFVTDYEKYTEPERRWLVTNRIKPNTRFKNMEEYEKNYTSRLIKDEKFVCENGDVIEKTYIDFPIHNVVDTHTNRVTKGALIDYIDNEKPEEGEFVFKFSFLIDEKPVYERIWDANVLHKRVRNGVDITNNDAIYRDIEPSLLYFDQAIIRGMTMGKLDLVYHIIKKICYVMSSAYTSDGNEYNKTIKYNNKTYNYSTHNRKYVNGWRKATEQKTKEYFNSLYPSDKQIERIEKRL